MIGSLLLTFSLMTSIYVEDSRPSVIVVYADDLGLGDLSCYGGKTALAQTPNLDRMASQGVRFNRYYSAAPICSPSRCGLLTGQFPARWKLTSYLQTRAGNKKCEQVDYLDPKAPSLPRVLHDAGYATLHVGKWHLGGGRDVVNPPKFAAYGYDKGLGTWESPEPAKAITARDWIWSAADEVKRWDRSRWMVDRTLDFLKEHPQAPCYVNLWLDDPHAPWVSSEEDQVPGKNGRATGKPNTPERLRGVLVEMDKQVGRLLDGVSALKRPVVVLFLSDNGPLPNYNRRRTTGLRGSKLSLYEGGVRLPGIAWGPGIVAAGKVNETTVVSAVDMFPTLCSLAGVKLPPGYTPDGENLLAALKGEEPKRSKPLLWEYGRNNESFDYPKAPDRSPNVAILEGDWKLLVNADGTGAELYDLKADRAESANLLKEKPEIAARLTEAALSWRRSMP